MQPMAEFARKSGIKLRLVQESGSPAIDTVTCTLDGVHVSEVLFESELDLNTSNAPLGWHELRIIAKGTGPLQHRFEQTNGSISPMIRKAFQKKSRSNGVVLRRSSFRKTPNLKSKQQDSFPIAISTFGTSKRRSVVFE